MNKNPIIKRIFYYLQIKTTSPLSIGNGEDENTDNDLLLDGQGKPFIPGTSIAGVISRYTHINIELEGNDYKQSPVYVSDARVSPSTTVYTDIRDGVSLDDNRIAKDGSKYDFEVVRTNTFFDFRIEVVVRKNDTIDMKKGIEDFIGYLCNGEVSFGGKTTRGYGAVELEKVYCREFTQNNVNDYLEFDPYKLDNYEDYEVSLDQLKIDTSKYHLLKVHMRQNGGLIIRKYTTKPNDVDYEQIRLDDTTALIPGTSWAGPLRKQFHFYNQQITGNDAIENQWFGYVDTSTGTAQKSKIIIKESMLREGVFKEVARNKIDRFTGGTVETALFEERPYFNGETTLTIAVPKEDGADYILGLFVLFILKDLRNGFMALGGEVSIGRGLFDFNDEDMTIDNKSINEDEYRKAVKAYVSKEVNV